MKEFLFVAVGLACFFACLFFGGCAHQSRLRETITLEECSEFTAFTVVTVCGSEAANAYLNREPV